MSTPTTNEKFILNRTEQLLYDLNIGVSQLKALPAPTGGGGTTPPQPTGGELVGSFVAFVQAIIKGADKYF